MTEPEREAIATDAAALRAAADVVIERLRALAASLTPAERSVLATMLAPAIAIADGDVTGFGSSTAALPEGVDLAVRESGLRVEEH